MMNILITDINWLAVAIATFAYFLFCGLWYSPIAFRKYWDKALGFVRPDKWKTTAIYFVVPLAGCLLASIAVAVLSKALHISSLAQAITFGVVTGVGFSVAVSFVNAVTPKMPKPLLYGLVTGVGHLIGIIIVFVIIYEMSNPKDKMGAIIGELDQNETLEIIDDSIMKRIDTIFPKMLIADELKHNCRYGIDVSRHQGKIDWGAIKDDAKINGRSVEYAFIKCTEGVTWIDEKYLANVKGCRTHKILFSSYHVFSVSADPVRQAKHFIQHYISGNFPPIIDIEYPNSKGAKIASFMNYIKSKLNVEPVIYSCLSDYNKLITEVPQLKNCSWWIAYHDKDTLPVPHAIWQYSCKGSVKGISGNVDYNVVLQPDFDTVRTKQINAYIWKQTKH